MFIHNSKTCIKRPLSKRPKLVIKTNDRLMQVRSIAERFKGECSKWEHSAILSTFIKLPFFIKIFVVKLSIFEWPFYTGFIVYQFFFFFSLIVFLILYGNQQ